MADFEKELEEVRAARKLKEQQMEATFETDVQTRFEKFKTEFQERMKQSPDIEGGRANEIKRWAKVLNSEQPDTLSPKDSDLNTAWADIQSAFIYRGGKPKPEQVRKYKTLRPRITFRPAEISKRDWLEFANVYPPLRTLHVEALAAKRFLDWLTETPAKQLSWDSSVRADFASLWAENVRDIVRHFSTPESAEVQVFKRPNRQALETIEQDLTETRATRNTENPATPWRTMELIEHSSRGEATRAELEALLKAKLEASEDYHTQRRLAKALLTELEGLLSKHGKLLQNLGAQPMPIAIASDWKDYLTTIARIPDPDMIAGQAFAFTADSKLIKKPALQTIVDYFNEKGAEVQLFTTGNALALQSLDEAILEEHTRYEANASELQALFHAKLTAAKDSGKVNTPQAFADAEADRLRRAWADDANRFPIAKRWLQYLERIASETATDSTEQPAQANTPPQGNEGGTGAEIEPETLEGSRESVVNILDPLQVAFLSTRDFEDAVTRLCQYFDGEEQQAAKPLKVRKGNNKKLGKALGHIHRDMKHRDSIGRDYLQFAKDTFDCFEGQDISHEKLTSANLYKYMTEKG